MAASLPQTIRFGGSKVSNEEQELIALLPDVFGRHDDFPADLIGATIVQMGTIPERKAEGGGLVIDYRPNGGESVRRALFAFNELGMWVESIETLAE